MVRMRLVRRSIGFVVKPVTALTCPTNSAISAILSRMEVVISKGGFLFVMFITLHFVSIFIKDSVIGKHWVSSVFPHMQQLIDATTLQIFPLYFFLRF